MLKKREVELIKLMCQQDDFKPVRFFAESLNVSPKTIRNDLDNLIIVFSEYKIDIKRIQGQGIKIVEISENEIQRLLSEIGREMHEKSMDITSRRRSIIYYLLINSSEYTTIKKLSDEYYVSASSIVNDFKSIERWLEQRNLKLKRSQEGTKIHGDEKAIRTALAKFIISFPSVEPNKTASQVYSRIDLPTRSKLLDLFDINEIEFFEDVISDIEIYTDIDIVDPYYINLMTHLLISVRRTKFRNELEEGNFKNQQDSVYTYIVEFISNKVENYFNIEYTDEEKNYILKYILGSFSSHDINPANEEVSNIVFELVSYMDFLLDGSYIADEELIRGLMLHIQPMISRLKFGIEIHNPLKGNIIDSHGKIFLNTSFVVNYLMKDRFGRKLTFDEITYLVTYFAASYERRNVKINCVVVCHSGYGTSQLLTARLNRSFPNLNITDVISTNQLRNLNYDTVDMIISTVYIENSPVNHIVVSAFLDEQEKERISDAIQNIQDDKGKSKTIDDLEVVNLRTTNKNIKEGISIYKNNNIEIKVVDSVNEGLLTSDREIYIVGSKENNLKTIKIINKSIKNENMEEILNGFIKIAHD